MSPFEFDMALQAPVFYMMRRGIRVDRGVKRDLSIEAHEKWGTYQKRLNEVVGRSLNVNSPKQVKEVLYGELGAPIRKKNKKVTTNEDALRSIMAFAEGKLKKLVQNEAKMRWARVFLCAKLILLIRGIRKEVSSYFGCPPGCSCKKPSEIAFDSDGRMRCTISVGGTETMRFSHSKTLWGTGLNMATIPHRLRTMFIADDDMELCELDLNRGESWVYAHLSEDPELMRIHREGLDFHSISASVVQTAFGSEGLSAEMIAMKVKGGDAFAYKLRYLGKRINHASAYRMGPFRGAQVINAESDDTNITVTPGEVEKAQKLWRQRYMGMEGWWSEIDRTISTTRTLETPYGRRRQFFGFMSEHLLKEATAYVPQSTSVDYMNTGMLRVYQDLIAKGAFGLELLHQNHDSILIQYPKEKRDEVIPEVMQRLTSTVIINGHDVTIPVEASCGQNWGDWHPKKNPGGIKEWNMAS